MARLRSTVVVAVAVATATACTGGSTPSAPRRPPGDGAATRPLHETLGRAVPHALVTAPDCPRLLDTLRDEARRQVTAYGLPGVFRGDVVYASADAVSGPVPLALGARTAANAGKSLAGASQHSTTNNQELDVDEPDLAKTDGRLIAVVQQGPQATVLRLVDVSGDQPHLAGQLRLPHIDGGSLFLDGDRVVVFGPARTEYRYAAGRPLIGGPYRSPDTRVVVVDVSDPTAPVRTRHLTVPGSLVDARLLGGRVVTVTQSSPRVALTFPHHRGVAARQQARADNRRAVASSTLSDWIAPVRGQHGQEWEQPCGVVYRPRTASGFGSVSVTSIDPAADADTAPHRATVFADAGVVYASSSTLYLATNAWYELADIRHGKTSDVTTRLHAFDLSEPDRPRYVASGRVPGSVVDQYALSENDGYLRVATTVGQGSPGPGKAPRSDNVVTVLEPRGGRLVPVGHVDGLGRGERIYGVRFLGDLAYVVTFRQVDPLYVLDLSDPTRPRMRGELKVSGYSAYLHPLGDGLLFGLGQAVGDAGTTEGVQASVFDVSDVSSPALRDRLRYPDSRSPAEDDPHAFLWWPQSRLVVVPLERYGSATDRSGDVVLHVSPDGSLTEAGTVHHPSDAGDDWRAQIERAIVVGDVLYTVSQEGVLASDLGSLATRTWLPFD